MADTFGASRKFRILAVIDDCTRENLALIADTSLSGVRVARELTALIRIYGKPGCIVSEPPRSPPPSSGCRSDASSRAAAHPTPSAMNRACQRQTQVFDLPVRAMIAPAPAPSVRRTTIRARQTCLCGEDGAEMIASRRCRSDAATVKGIPLRIPTKRTSSKTRESQSGLLRSDQSPTAHSKKCEAVFGMKCA